MRTRTMMLRANLVLLPVAAILVATFGGCPAGLAVTPAAESTDDTGRVTAPEYVLKAEVLLLDQLAPEITASVSGDGVTYSGLPSSVLIEQGDVLLSTTGEGYLRTVVSVDHRQGGEVYVQTAPASLEEVFQEATFSVSAPLVFEDQPPSAKTKKIDFDTPVGLHPVLEIAPEITIDTGLTYHCDVSYSHRGLRSVECYVTGTLTADALFVLSVGAGVHAQAERDLIPTMVVGGFLLGPIPVTVNFDLSLGGEFDFDVAGSLSKGAALNMDMDAGVGYTAADNRIYPVARHQVSFTRHELEWKIGATPSLEVHLGEKLSLKAVGIAGPYVQINAPSLKASYEDGVVSVAPGVSAEVGGELKIFSLRLLGVSVDVFDVRWDPWRWTVYQPVVASAGPDKTISAPGGSVPLDGSAIGGDGNFEFSWSPTMGLNNPNIAQPTASAASTTTYTLTVTDDTGASDTDDVVVQVRIPDALSADAGPDKNIASPGGSVTLEGSASGGDAQYTFSWLPATGLSDSHAAQPTATPNATTTYTLTVKDGTGASDTDAVIVTVGVTVGDAPYVGGSGNFTRTNGSFEIAISPQDSQGNFIGTDLPETAFAFRNVVLDPDAAGGDVPVTTNVTGTDVTEPSQGQAITAVVIFDSSGSMGSNDPGAVGRRAGGNAFFDLLTTDDEVAVLDFGAGTSGGLTHSRLLQDFTSDVGLLEAALTRLAQSGGTPLYGSITDGLGLLSAKLGGMGGVLIALTDGQASDSGLLETAVGQAQSQQVSIYPIGLGDNIDFSQLADLAQQTGGTFAEASDAAAMQAAFQGVGAEVTVGKVTVRAACTYAQADPGRYTVRGELVTTSGAGAISTAFSFTVNIP